MSWSDIGRKGNHRGSAVRDGVAKKVRGLGELRRKQQANRILQAPNAKLELADSAFHLDSNADLGGRQDHALTLQLLADP